MQLEQIEITVVGAGEMGGAIVRGLVAGGRVLAGHIRVSNPSKPKLETLERACPGVHTTTSNVEAVREAHRRGCDAVVFHWFRATSEEYSKLTRLLAECRMASFAQSGEEFVKHGILLGVGNESFEGYGAFEADVIRRVLEGTSPRKCPQVFAERSRFVINLVSAIEIGWTPDFGVLVAMEKSFVTQR